MEKIKVGKFRGISGIEHEIMYVNDGKETYLYVELKNPNIEDIVKTIAVALDLKLKPYVVVRSGSIPDEWVKEISKVGGKVIRNME
ncbi:MAG: hypothetical protein DRN04_15235 [Thermoprotei archaeon]|nr:MAG: hypothetical protein DRN04_15235 [Thermoprotei archaeon]